jgi:quinol monooxygenase YgiN
MIHRHNRPGLNRRWLMTGLVSLLSFAWVRKSAATSPENPNMYGLITQFLTTPENREALVAVLVAGSKNMPGCLSYVVAKDAAKADTIWITEVWQDKQSHADSLKLPSVQAAMTKGRPLMTGIGTRVETVPEIGPG